ncbi:hypothetical protein FVEG_08801 [Fusarium verticillioides 7600]|uniref:Uncharacterized protein n=1 Tax=Gibberella moniliformis (strain M3125 / FGSC 7600) TaxID=334819 RepID=W7ME29_GIBM7|nr:hypothetical protein FVEG_08801 [Fusarium verticillioides 7600]EWG49216.1 hypothetical protein FVEG_08801 [Fusarium verticillioides 7600]
MGKSEFVPSNSWGPATLQPVIPESEFSWNDWSMKSGNSGISTPKTCLPTNLMIELINDVFTASATYKDTAKIFPREIELSRAGDKMAWVEGQMLGEADEGTKAPISRSVHFATMTDSRRSLAADSGTLP